MKYDISEIRALYAQGRNIVDWFRNKENGRTISDTAILYAYDVQAGSYTVSLRDPAIAQIKTDFGRKLAAVLDEFEPKTLLDAGIGEATTAAPYLSTMSFKPKVFGFDMSLSRLLYARSNLEAAGIADSTLFTSGLDAVAMPAGAIDVVVTVHAIEPNHGREEKIISELLRVARRALVMVEPSFEFGSKRTQERIKRNGYIRGLPSTISRLGFELCRHEKWGLDINPDNEAALLVVKKPEEKAAHGEGFISPISGTMLVRRPDCWFSRDDGHAFPIISGIPCLTAESAVLASKLGTV